MYLLVSIQLILRKLSCGRDIALGKEAGVRELRTQWRGSGEKQPERAVVRARGRTGSRVRCG